MLARTVVVIVAAVTCGLLHQKANAQFGMPMQLPASDFVWTWGTDLRRGITDINVIGTDTRFRCDLKVKLRISSGLGRNDVRALEAQLRQSMFFVQETVYTMNSLETYGNLDWAVLDCKVPENDDSEDEIAEREAKARERAERARERRRSRDRD